MGKRKNSTVSEMDYFSTATDHFPHDLSPPQSPKLVLVYFVTFCCTRIVLFYILPSRPQSCVHECMRIFMNIYICIRI